MLVTAVFALVGCVGPADPLAGATRVPTPSSRPAGLAWLADGSLVTAQSIEPRESLRIGLARFVLPDGGWQPLPVAGLSGPQCPMVELVTPTRLPDGRLGSVLGCTDPFALPPITAYSIIAIDHETGAVETLADFATFAQGLGVGTITFSMEPGLRRGVASVFGGLCSALVWIDGGRAEPMEIQVGEGAQRFTVGRRPGGGAEACDTSGQATFPAWSPDGKQIAFLASPASVGVEGFNRLQQPFELYVMDAVERQPRVLLRDIRQPRQLAWSPNGSALLLSGRLAQRGEATVLLRPSTGQLVDVARVALEWPSVSPDGTRVGGGYYRSGRSPEDEGTTEIVIVPNPSP